MSRCICPDKDITVISQHIDSIFSVQRSVDRDRSLACRTGIFSYQVDAALFGSDSSAIVDVDITAVSDQLYILNSRKRAVTCDIARGIHRNSLRCSYCSSVSDIITGCQNYTAASCKHITVIDVVSSSHCNGVYCRYCSSITDITAGRKAYQPA